MLLAYKCILLCHIIYNMLQYIIYMLLCFIIYIIIIINVLKVQIIVLCSYYVLCFENPKYILLYKQTNCLGYDWKFWKFRFCLFSFIVSRVLIFVSAIYKSDYYYYYIVPSYCIVLHRHIVFALI